MPIVNNEQARVELSESQYTMLTDLFADAARIGKPPMIWIEETNLPGVIAIGSKFGTVLMGHDGSYHHFTDASLTGEEFPG